MKKVSISVVCCLVLSLAAFAAPKSAKMTGWVSDAMCGAKGASAAHAACAKKCADKGEALVFVDDKDHKVMKIANQDAVKDHMGEHVSIMASEKDGALQIDKVTAMSDSGAKSDEKSEHMH
jgi:hypothetical protein